MGTNLDFTDFSNADLRKSMFKDASLVSAFCLTVLILMMQSLKIQM